MQTFLFDPDTDSIIDPIDHLDFFNDSLVSSIYSILQERELMLKNEKQAIIECVRDVLMNTQPSNDKAIYTTISIIIASFSTGFIFNCCNTRVHKAEDIEISASRYDFDHSIDDNGYEIYYYYPTEHNQLYAITYKNTEKIRIFCSSCTKNELLPCHVPKSKSQPCCIKDTAFIQCNSISSNKNISILACYNHERCNFCNKPTETDLFTDQISNCRTCSNRMHRKCSNRGICSICCASSERKNLFLPINASLKHILFAHLINIIVDYVMGFTVPCANCYNTQSIIDFESEWQFKKKLDQNGVSIQYYQLTKYNKLPSNIVYGTKIRAFCKECVSVLVKCVRCNTMDAIKFQNIWTENARQQNICHNHEKCVCCNAAVRYQRHCSECNRALCKKCYSNCRNDCKGCLEKEQNVMRYEMRMILNSVLRLILNQDLLNIIADYAIGYVFYCCNENMDCKNDIVCDSVQQIELTRTTPKFELIYYYIIDSEWTSWSYVSKQGIRLERTANSKVIRIFCKECVVVINKCLWKKCDNYDSRSLCISHSTCYECNGENPKDCDRCKVNVREN